LDYFLVEAAGVEPASENIPLQFLRTYPLVWLSQPVTPKGRLNLLLSRVNLAPSPTGVGKDYPALNDAPSDPAGEIRKNVSRLSG